VTLLCICVDQPADGDSLGNGDDVAVSGDMTPSKMEDTHQTYMDMFAGTESDADTSQDNV